mmetsp:Transcript_32570/g.73230  ORF Transcript_32570/g.73230 Transcript_32570/m.73230 type:complete len:89 (-) Transcript_32570:1469-1735(-)
MKAQSLPAKRIQDRDWKTPFPPWAIDLTDPNAKKDPMVEAILNSTSPKPIHRTYGNGGRPLKEFEEKPHSALTNNGYARNSLGGFYTC